MRLQYTNPRKPGEPRRGALPLPAGWPAADHDEPDEVIANEKIASGRYRREPTPVAKPKAKEDADERD